MSGADERTDERTDEALVGAAVAGDYGAFEALVRRYSDRVFRLAWSYMKSDHEAEEVVQETFLNVHRALPRFEGKAQFGSWIYRITVNAALMRLRRKRRRPEASLDETRPRDFEGAHHDTPLLVEHDTPADAQRRAELGAEIQRAVDQLDEKYRVVFVLRDVEGMSIAETAEILDLSEAAIKSRLHRARLFLRASLQPYLD